MDTLAHIVDALYSRGAETAYVQRRGYRIFQWSYRQVAETSRRLARELLNRGIGPGDKVIIWGEGCAEWVISFFACVMCGAVAVPIDRFASPEFACRVCREVKARLSIGSHGQPCIDSSISVLAFENFSEFLAGHSCAPLPIPKLDKEDPVEIVYTSGTTAAPKGVVISHRNILANLDPLERQIRKYLKYERFVHPLRFLNVLPLSHVFGQFMGLFIPQILGATVVFPNSLNPSEIIRAIRRERISVLVTVPRVIDSIREKMERDLENRNELEKFRQRFNAASAEHFIKRWWRFRRIHRQFGWKFWAFISGGASLSAASEQFWGRLGFAVVQGYGLTETASLISLNHPLKLAKGSIGKILPGREFKLAPDGEILVRGESIAQSYYQAGETKSVSADEGWFHTGDIGTVDEQGNLYFKGRRKNVLVSPEGMNIYPEDLEIALRNQPEVRDCVVLGVEHDGNAEPCAVLILQHRDQDPAAIVQRANESLADYQRIRRWLLWPGEDFPRTSTLKPQIAPIQAFMQSLCGADVSQGSERVTLNDMIASITGRKAEKPFRESDLIKDLNLSSIERVELLSALEDRYQLDIDEARFTEAKTIGELESLIDRPVNRRAKFDYPVWPRSLPVSVIRKIVYYVMTWPATMLLARPGIRGRENLRNAGGPLLFVSNHITRVDVGFLLAALPPHYRHRLAVAMSGELLREMKEPPPEINWMRKWFQKAAYKLLLALFNVFPLPQKAGFRESFEFAGQSVDRGYSILVFPEGTRTQDGKMNSFRSGIGILATNLQIPVVPVRIDGLFNLKKAGRKYARLGAVRVTIGPPVRYDSKMNPAAIALDLERRVGSI